MSIEEVLAELETDVAKTKVDTDFGLLGVVARMNTNFHALKEHFNTGKRRKKVNEKVRQALKQITLDAVIAQTLV